MKIYRAAEDKLVPNWVFASKTEFPNEAIGDQDAEKILNMSCNISDDELVMERDKIEKCASSKVPYFYNVQWPDNVKSELKEYAAVCKMDMSKFQAVDPVSLIDKITVVKAATSSPMVKTASAKIILNDPFHLDTAGDNPHMAKANWEEVKKEVKLEERPMIGLGVIPIRGGEDYFANSEAKVAKGQNSITDPNAIGKLSESDVEDTGARLQREKLEREAAKEAEHKKWQEDKAMPKDITSRSVFQTESLNAQPGIRGNVFDFTTVPELTEGEKLHTANEERRRQIRGEDKKKHEFTVEKNPTPTISDTFAEELKKALGK
jgi:hypothetical protein